MAIYVYLDLEPHSFQMRFILPLLLLVANTNAQRVTNFDYFDFDEVPTRANVPSSRGRVPDLEVAERPQTTTPVPILQQINE